MSKFFESAKSWPFVEARKIIARLERGCSKGEVILETGYGPSGLPHIGTFGEVLRTTFVMRAFRMMSDVPAKILVFSDDMDGLRKVPSNVPNQDSLAEYLERPLTSVPDPFGTCESFAHYNNAMLQRFLDSFGFEYEFKSSTSVYKSGFFNEYLSRILEHYNEIMEIMLPSLREERQKTYSPFLPMCRRTGRVLRVPIEKVDTGNMTVTYRDPETDNLEEVSVLDGNCKLQWKADWGMRWAAFGVDYEMNGKDLIDSFRLSSRICRAIGGEPPENLTYELFLDEDGRKISKSKGNGLSIDEWLKYAPSNGLAYYLFQNPTRAKRLHFDVIPNAMDEYMESIEKFSDGDFDNPVFHVHGGNLPIDNRCPKFSMLLNLVQACGTADENVLFDFVRKYVGETSGKASEFIRMMIGFAVRYYRDFVEGMREFAVPNEGQRAALLALKRELLENADCPLTADELQAVVFEVGKKFFPGKLKDWFMTLYRVLLGADSGPKIGSFISLYGLENIVSLIESKIANAEQ
jgi:lysyl-tRNA synthetase class 1